MIGYCYLEHFDLINKSSEPSWLAVGWNTEGRDWKRRYLKVLCGVFGLMNRHAGQEQWKNNCSIYRGPFNRRGSSVSLTGTHSICYPELSPSSVLEIGLWVITTCFQLCAGSHMMLRCLYVYVWRPRWFFSVADKVLSNYPFNCLCDVKMCS